MIPNPPKREDMPVQCEPLTVQQIAEQPVFFEFSRELPCSPSALFAHFEDPLTWPRWATGIGAVIWTSSTPYGPGTTRTVRFWGGAEVYERFMVFEPPHRMAFTFEGTSEPIWEAFGERYEVEAVAEGQCRLTWGVGYRPMGVFGRIHPLIKPIMKVNLASYLWRLERDLRRHGHRYEDR